MDRCAEILRPHLGGDLREVLYPQGGSRDDRDEAERRLQETVWAQPVVFVTGDMAGRLDSPLRGRRKTRPSAVATTIPLAVAPAQATAGR